MTLTKPFDRHSFDPVNDWEDQKYLKKLRSRGARRRFHYNGRHRYNKGSGWGVEYFSTGFRWHSLASSYFFCSLPEIEKDGRHYWDTRNKTFLDLGCGDSPDAAFAHRELGMKSYAIDLFPPSVSDFPYDPEKEEFTFIQSDMVDEIPLEKGSVDAAHCAAVIDLLSPYDRLHFYLNVLEVLKSGAKFVVTMQKLSRGHGLNPKDEAQNLLWAGFRIDDQSISNRIVAIKP